MLKSCVVLLSLLLWVFLLAAQDNQTTPSASSTVSEGGAHQVNPVKATAESLARGKKYYGYDCAMCHGDNGNGKGEVAVSEKLTVRDWTNPATLQGKTDGELFSIIKNGKGKMPPEGDRVKATELWNMVNYVRSLAGKTAQ
jgi:mono/diheme cytochrome c family protein